MIVSPSLASNLSQQTASNTDNVQKRFIYFKMCIQELNGNNHESRLLKTNEKTFFAFKH